VAVHDPDMRATLRALPVLIGAAPAFDPSRAPDDPVALFVEWLTAAVEAGVPEPHAPDARMLILKDPQPLADTADLDVALAKARLEADPALVPDEWVSYAVAPERVEL
jgi:pyridoxine/pyridoxamine 5'-phosphate oxidase